MTARNMPATAPMALPEPPRDAAANGITHPHWCDRTRCNATPTAAMGEAHRGTPVAVPAAGPSPDDLTTTASLYQAHAPWTTSVLVELDVSGRDERWRPVASAARVIVEQAGELARVLVDLAADGAAEQTRQAADHRSAIRGREAGR